MVEVRQFFNRMLLVNVDKESNEEWKVAETHEFHSKCSLMTQYGRFKSYTSKSN